LIDCVLASLIIFFAPSSFTNKFQLAFAQVFRRPLGLGRTLSLSATAPDAVDDSERSYRNYIANLEKWLDSAQRRAEESSRLRQRLPLENAKLMPADVTVAPDRSSTGLFVNRGQSDGLANGQFVLGENSIVGAICDVWPRAAQVRLITDPESKIPVEIGDLNLHCLMQGRGDGTAAIRMLSKKHKVKPGQKVYAAPRLGFMDDHIIVGEIVRCRPDVQDPLLLDITVQPVCQINQLYNVAVIVMPAEK
jgi:rod shape-determining protein MreC